MKRGVTMKTTKLILIAGMSGAGKSTTAQRISKQLTANEIPHKWLHEEMAHHPIREGEFDYGDLKRERDMDINCDRMVKKWERLTETILSSDEVYVMEGCLYQNITRYFFDAHYPEAKMTAFYDRVMETIAPLRPVFIYLRPNDVRRALENVYPIRGQWWKDLILKPEYDGYFKNRPYEGEESIYQMYEHSQAISDLQYNRFNGWKIQIDTTSGDWESHLKTIMDFLELPFRKERAPWIPERLAKYEGTYSVTIEGSTRRIHIYEEHGRLYCKGFWPYMVLEPVERDVFEVASFPMTFHFKRIDGKKAIKVTGNYDWEIVGKTLVSDDE